MLSLSAAVTLQAEPCGPAREPANIERRHLAAVSGCRLVKGIGEIHALSAHPQRGLDVLLVLGRYGGQQKKVFEAREDFVSRLLGELRLRSVVAQAVPGQNVGINCAHAGPPS
jgi:hypothetical protein